ncbi:MAG: peptidylprolyl isomerase [Armatimonadetes bacterium]|jgi:putative peptide maturation system protein|nr:peptidylprolyl isomerase [Armatimonadota bacterium]
MPELSEIVAVEVNGKAISLQEALRFAFWRGQLGFLDEITDAAIIEQAAARRGITATDAELQAAADEFRAVHGLHKASTTLDWLASNGLTVDDWEQYLESCVLIAKVRDALFEGQVEQYFAENRLAYEAAIVSRLVTKDEGVAEELRAQIIDEGAEFSALARQYSTDAATRAAGGYLGRVTRADLSADLQAAVFGAQPGEVIGPIRNGDDWVLIKVEERQPATLTPMLREVIKARLMVEWLAAERGKAQIRKPVLTQL